MLTPSCGGKETIRLSDELEEMHFSIVFNGCEVKSYIVRFLQHQLQKAICLDSQRVP